MTDRTIKSKLRNPVLPGFNPDPSGLVVGREIYIATSTFQWWPGVAIYHSRNLQDWTQLPSPLTRVSQLDLRGVPASAGVYAPQISYADGVYFLAYTNVQGNAWPFMDCPNYVVTAPSASGPWSEPSFLHAKGFDPSIFHDDDGTSWLLSNEIGSAIGKRRSLGIVMQQLDRRTLKLVGEPVMVSDRDSEGPHLVKRKGWYYLILAEGGTKYNHRAEVLRSRSRTGPFELSPYGTFLTSKSNPALNLQKAGHASLFEIPNGDWWIAHLAARPLEDRRCPLGRETCLQRVEWTDDWPVIEGGGHEPRDEWTLDVLSYSPQDDGVWNLDRGELPGPWMTLREPLQADWCVIDAAQRSLRLRGRQSLFSRFSQSLIGLRLQSLSIEASVTVRFQPRSYRQAAGISLYYDSENFFFLRITCDGDSSQASIGLLRADGAAGDSSEEVSPLIALPAVEAQLKVEVSGPHTQFYYRLTPSEAWSPVGGALPTGEISDDQRDKYGFTGAFIALSAWDMAHASAWAEFKDFVLTNHETA